MSKYPPGPLHVFGRQIRDKNDYIIATCENSSHDHARLFALSPNLLNELARALFIIGSLMAGRKPVWEVLPPDVQEQWRDIAIRKAEEQSQ